MLFVQWVLIFFLFIVFPASAKVYRCDSEEGTVYQQVPCYEGRQSQLRTPPSAAPKSENYHVFEKVYDRVNVLTLRALRSLSYDYIYEQVAQIEDISLELKNIRPNACEQRAFNILRKFIDTALSTLDYHAYGTESQVRKRINELDRVDADMRFSLVQLRTCE